MSNASDASADVAGSAVSRTSIPPLTYLASAIAIGVACLMASPLAVSLFASIKTPADASAVPPTYLPTELSLQNYWKVINYQAGLVTYAGNSLCVALLTIVFCLVLAIPAGFGLARFDFKFREAAFMVLLLPAMIPYQALLTPLYLDFARVGLVDTYVGLAIVHTILQLPFSIYLMRSTFESIPRELDEAATMDGCSSLSILWRIFLPLAVPGVVTVALFAFITSWNEFLGALIFMNRETSFTVPILLVAVRTGNHGSVDWGALQAGVIVSIIPCLLLYLSLRRYYLAGLLAGAVK